MSKFERSRPFYDIMSLAEPIEQVCNGIWILQLFNDFNMGTAYPTILAKRVNDSYVFDWLDWQDIEDGNDRIPAYVFKAAKKLWQDQGIDFPTEA